MMAALVQSFPQSTTVTMLQTRPTSASGNFQNGPQGQQHQRNAQMPVNLYNSGVTTGSYRGHTSISPVVPYAFSSTPSLVNSTNPLSQNPTKPHLQPENRTSSAPVLSHSHQTVSNHPVNNNRPRYPMTSSISTPSLSNSVNANTAIHQRASKDDSSIPTQTFAQVAARPLSTIDLNSSLPSPASSPLATLAKSTPDRYRRGTPRAQKSGATMNNHTVGGSAPPSGSGMATIGHLYNPLTQSNPSPTISSPSSTYRGSQMTQNIGGSAFGAQPRLASMDDMNPYRQPSNEQAKRYRRRSISSLEAVESTGQSSEGQGQPFVHSQKSSTMTLNSPSHEQRDTHVSPIPPRPSPSRGRSGSDESTTSVRSHSRPSSVSPSLLLKRTSKDLSLPIFLVPVANKTFTGQARNRRISRYYRQPHCITSHSSFQTRS